MTVPPPNQPPYQPRSGGRPPSAPPPGEPGQGTAYPQYQGASGQLPPYQPGPYQQPYQQPGPDQAPYQQPGPFQPGPDQQQPYQQPGYRPGYGQPFPPRRRWGWNYYRPIPNAGPWIALVVSALLLLPAVLIPIATTVSTHEHQAYSDGVSATGTVQSVQDHVSYTYSRHGNQRRDDYTVTIAFTTADGQNVSFSDEDGSDPPAEGAQVPVSYRAADPQDARWVRASTIEGGLIAGGILLAIALGGFVLSAVLFRRRARRRSALTF